MNQFVIGISKIDRRDIDIAGKYAVELGELSKIGIPIPESFVITISGFKHFLAENNKNIIREISKAYKLLGGFLNDSFVIVTSSSPSGLNNINYEVKGDANLIQKIKQIWAMQSGVAIVVQKKIVSEKNGILFTEDPHTADKTIIHIKHRNMVSHYSISKKNLDIIFKGHLSKTNWSHKISDQEAIELASIGKKLQKYFYFPQEVKFAIYKNRVCILETKTMMRAVVVPVSYDSLPYLSSYKPKVKREILLRGISNFPGIVTGQVRIIPDLKELKSVFPGQIIVTSKISPDSFPLIKKIRGIVVENIPLVGYSRILYSNIVAKPSIFNVKNATKILHTGNVVTVDGAKGVIYKGGFN